MFGPTESFRSWTQQRLNPLGVINYGIDRLPRIAWALQDSRKWNLAKFLNQIGRPRIADSVQVWFRVTSVLFATNSRISRGRINPGCEVCTNDSISNERSRDLSSK